MHLIDKSPQNYFQEPICFGQNQMDGDYINEEFMKFCSTIVKVIHKHMDK